MCDLLMYIYLENESEWLKPYRTESKLLIKVEKKDSKRYEKELVKLVKGY